MVTPVRKIQQQLSGVLAAGEAVEFATVCQLKAGVKREVARTLIDSVTATTVVNTVMSGAGVMVLHVPPAVWCVVTSSRILMFNRVGIKNNAKSLGPTVFDARRDALAADLSAGLLRNSLTLVDPQDGRSVCVLRFGARRSAPRTIASTCRGARD